MKSFLRGSTWIIAILVAIAVLLNLFVFDSWVVPSAGDDPMMSMALQPNLLPGERVLVSRGGPVTYGQLARCTAPDGQGQVIGRLFGLGGDTVEIKQERVIVAGKPVIPRHGCGQVPIVHPANGQTLTLQCAVEENGAWTYQILHYADFPEGDRTAKVEEGRAFLVSDNRHLHWDSRDYGTVDASTCEHIVFRLWGETFIDSRRLTILY